MKQEVRVVLGKSVRRQFPPRVCAGEGSARFTHTQGTSRALPTDCCTSRRVVYCRAHVKNPCLGIYRLARLGSALLLSPEALLLVGEITGAKEENMILAWCTASVVVSSSVGRLCNFSHALWDCVYSD